jgi:hypothetical protein
LAENAACRVVRGDKRCSPGIIGWKCSLQSGERGHALLTRHHWVPRLQAVAAKVGGHEVEVRDIVVDNAVVCDAGSGDDAVMRELSDGRAGLAVIVLSHSAEVTVHVICDSVHYLDLHACW